MIKTSFKGGFFFIGLTLTYEERDTIFGLVDVLIERAEENNEDTTELQESRAFLERIFTQLN